jgi:hypothetical protein
VRGATMRRIKPRPPSASSGTLAQPSATPATPVRKLHP